jgi:hypothetical protein
LQHWVPVIRGEKLLHLMRKNLFLKDERNKKQSYQTTLGIICAKTAIERVQAPGIITVLAIKMILNCKLVHSMFVET